LFAVGALASVVPSQVATDELLGLVLRLAKDPVPNIRFNVARVLEKMLPFLEASSLQTQVLPALSSLSEDTDVDVKFFANQCILAIRKKN